MSTPRKSVLEALPGRAASPDPAAHHGLIVVAVVVASLAPLVQRGAASAARRGRLAAPPVAVDSSTGPAHHLAMSLMDKLDASQIKALAEKAGIDQAKLVSLATSMLPTLKDKWQSLAGGGDTPLFQDLMANQKFMSVMAAGELDGAAAKAAAEHGLDLATVKKLMPELGKIVAQ